MGLPGGQPLEARAGVFEEIFHRGHRGQSYKLLMPRSPTSKARRRRSSSTPSEEVSMKRIIKQAMVIGLAAALVVGALAVANQGSGSGKSHKGSHRHRFGPPRPPGDLTYSEAHVQVKGKGVVFRVDRGKVKSVDSDSITVTENDGNDVSVPTDGGTKVFAGPRRGQLELSDLKDGQTVMAPRQRGRAPVFVGTPPSPGASRGFTRRGHGPGHGGPPPPGPGAFPAPPLGG